MPLVKTDISMASNSPPQWPIRMLKRLLDARLFDAILGDLEEDFYTNAKDLNYRRARVRFIFGSLAVLRHYRLRRKVKIQRQNSNFMLSNYLKITFRNIRRQKLISSINILGLSLGVAVSLLLGVYANGIMTYDQFHENADDIYYLYRTRPTPEGSNIDVPDTWAPLVEEVKKEFPSVVEGTRFSGGGTTLIYNNTEFDQGIMYSDQGLFNMFSFPLEKGNAETLFEQPNSIVISAEVAERVFGDEDPVGKVVQLQIGRARDFVVKGVLGDIPFNSSFNFDIIVNLESRRQEWTERGLFDWRGSFMISFLQLRSDQNPEDLMAQFPKIVEKFVPERERGTLELMPLKDYYDFNTGQQQYGFILFYIAIGILTIAVINFTNLNAAQSLVRHKEVGVRKVFGAGRKNLVTQFIGESVITSTASFIIGISLAFLMLPKFISLFQQEISLDFILLAKNIPILLVGILLIGILSGFYPTMILSRLQPRAIFQDAVTTGKKGFDSKNILVVLQFSIAIMLISAVILMNQQIHFMKGANMNFDANNVVLIGASSGNFQDQEEGVARIQTLRNSIEALSGVESVSAANSAPGRYAGSFILVQSDDAKDKPPLDWRFVRVDHQFFETMKMEFIEGRNFDPNLSTDQGLKAVLNETAVKQLGWSTVEGRRLVFPGRDGGIEIIGVVKDFNYQSLASGIEPVIHLYGGRTSSRYSFLLVKLNDQNISSTLSQMETFWGDFDQSSPFNYSFLDQDFERLYQTEERVASMISYATVLAIIVAVLGILGLASFSVIQRMKEVAIRKVLGASTIQIMSLLVRKFTIMLIVSLLVAVPFNYYFISDWLNTFAFRIDISILVYVLSGLTVLVVTWLVLSGYALKAVKANPANTLRHE